MDAPTGKVRWSVLDEYRPSGPVAATIAANSNLIYVGFNGTQKVSGDTEWGAARIVAYHASSGNSDWSAIVGGARRIESLIATETTVSIDGGYFSSNYYLFDAETGKTIEAKSKQDGNFVWFITNGISYERAESSSFQAVNRQTGSIIWESEFNVAIYQPPSLIDNVILARSNDATSTGAVFALSSLTGKMLWNVGNVVSNVAVDNSIAYFLTLDARLLALDVKTGTTLGEINFGSNNVVLQDADLFLHGFSVAVIDNIVGIHFGDSLQLFAFRFSQDE